MEQHIGAFGNQFLPTAGERGDHRFGRFLAQLLRDLGNTLGIELRDIAAFRRSVASRGDNLFQSGQSRG